MNFQHLNANENSCELHQLYTISWLKTWQMIRAFISSFRFWMKWWFLETKNICVMRSFIHWEIRFFSFSSFIVHFAPMKLLMAIGIGKFFTWFDSAVKQFKRILINQFVALFSIRIVRILDFRWVYHIFLANHIDIASIYSCSF